MTPEKTYIPAWMRGKAYMSQPALPPQPTEEEKKKFEEERKKLEEEAKKQKQEFLTACRTAALALNVVPLYGQIASAAALAACEAGAAGFGSGVDESGVFGPISQEENKQIAAEIARGAPKSPPFCIIDCTAAEKKKYESDRIRYERNYARWKHDDMLGELWRFTPTAGGQPQLTSEQWGKFTEAEKKEQAEKIAKFAVAAQMIEEPTWLKMAARDEARQMVDRLRALTTPTVTERLGALGIYEYVALGVAALVAAVAAAIAVTAGRRRRPARSASVSG